jgi:hypothetical protein
MELCYDGESLSLSSILPSSFFFYLFSTFLFPLGKNNKDRKSKAEKLIIFDDKGTFF